LKIWKKATPLLRDLVNITTKYHGLLTALATTGQQMGHVLEALSKCYEGDAAAAVGKIGQVHKQLDTGMAKIAEEIMSNVIVPVGAHYGDEFKSAMNWGKESKKKRANSLAIIKKHEERAKKMQKKAARNPQIMEPILQNLEESITAHDKLLGDSLKEIRGLERGRVCSLVDGWVNVIGVECEVLGISWDDLNNCKDGLKRFASDTSNYGDADVVIQDSRPNSTMEQLKEARRTGYYDSNQMAYLQDSLRMSSLHLNEMAGGSPSDGAPPIPGRGAPPLPGRPPSNNYGQGNSEEDYYGDGWLIANYCVFIKF